MTGIDHLDDLGTAALRTVWHQEFSQPPPARASDEYMRSVLAYRMQEKVGPRLSASTRRKLIRIAGGNDNDPAPCRTPARRLTAGTQLLREWNGVTHKVSVLDHGFEYRGRPYRSLSAIAREITGARWSGPRFFGLNLSSQIDAG